jgi:hypothetical protein
MEAHQKASNPIRVGGREGNIWDGFSNKGKRRTEKSLKP